MSEYKITFYKGGRKAPAPFKNIALIGSVEEIDLFFTSSPVIGASYVMNCAHRIDPAGLFMCDLDIATAYGFNYAIVENTGEIPYFCYVKNPVYKNNKTLLSLEVDVLNTFFRRDSLEDYVGATSRCRLLAKHRSVAEKTFSRNVLPDKKDKSRVLRSLLYSDDQTDSNKTRYAIVISKSPLTDKLYGMFRATAEGVEGNPLFIKITDTQYVPGQDLATVVVPTISNGLNTGVYCYVVPFSTVTGTSSANWIDNRYYNYNEDVNPGVYKAASGLSLLSQLIEDPNVIDIYVVNKVNDDISIGPGAEPAGGKVGIGVSNAPHGLGKGVPLYYAVGSGYTISYGACMYISDTKYLEDTVFDTDVESVIGQTYGYNLDGARHCLKNVGCVQLVLNDSYAIDARYLNVKEDGKTELLIKRKKVVDGGSLKEIYCIYRYKNYPGAYDTKSAHVDEDLARLVLKTDAWQNYAVNNKVQLRSGFIVQTALSAVGSLISGNYMGAALGAAGSIASEFINRANLKAIPDEIRNNGSALFQFALNECRPVIKVYTYTDDVENEIVNDYKLNGEDYDVPQTVTLAEAMTRPTAYYFALKCEIIDPITNAPPEYADQLNDILFNGIRVYVLANMNAYSDDLTSWSKDKNFEEV